jgi:sulfatase maturation enzyme AslB (radical SAM superfamily)
MEFPTELRRLMLSYDPKTSFVIFTSMSVSNGAFRRNEFDSITQACVVALATETEMSASDVSSAHNISLVSKDEMKKYLESDECSCCGIVVSRPNICSRCKAVRYCNKQCQKKDWSRFHKHVCEVLQKAKSSGKRYISLNSQQ